MNRQRSAEPTIPLATNRIDGHVVTTGGSVWAWYRLAPQRWSFRPDGEREQLITSTAAAYADLVGRNLHVRVTHRPLRPGDWARRHHERAVDRPADVAGALSWDEFLERVRTNKLTERDALSWDAYLLAEQTKLAERAIAQKEVYVGVEVRHRNWWDVAREWSEPLLRKVAPDALDDELRSLEEEIDQLDTTMATSGFAATPVTPDELRWLYERSVGLGLDAHGRDRRGAVTGAWAREDLASLDIAELEQRPFAPGVMVRGKGAYANEQAYTVVLSMGLMQPLHIPQERRPWMTWGDQLNAAVEWSMRLRVCPDEQVVQRVQKQTRKVRAQANHYLEHELEPPHQLGRQNSQAPRVEDELTNGFNPSSSRRVEAWVRVAISVSADAEALRTSPERETVRIERAALKQAEALEKIYNPQVRLEHPDAQWSLAREFIPGEALATTAWRRHGSVVWAAAAVPTATAKVGDETGSLLGETVNAERRPVFWDMWQSQETGGSGLSGVVAGLNGGKSTLFGMLVVKSVRAGARWNVLDPSGPLKRLADVPELAPYVRVIDLTKAPQPGILNPYRVVAEPKLEQFRDEPDPHIAWQRERSVADATRRRLVGDVLKGVLPHEYQQQYGVQAVLDRAVRAVGGGPEHSPVEVLHQLKDLAGNPDFEYRQDAENVLGRLEDMQDRLRSLFPESAADDPYAGERQDRLTVFTMPGLQLPKDGASRDELSDEERVSVQLMSLAAWLTERGVYDADPAQRKGVFIDEAFFLSEVPSGRVLMNRFARDSRKFNARVLLASQVPADLLNIPGFVTLSDSMFVGRLKGDQDVELRDALRLLEVPQGVGYEQLLGELSQKKTGSASGRDYSPREFIFRDTVGIERIKVDISGEHLYGMSRALDSHPGAHSEPHSAEPDEPAEHSAPPARVDPSDAAATNGFDPDGLDRELTDVLHPINNAHGGDH